MLSSDVSFDRSLTPAESTKGAMTHTIPAHGERRSAWRRQRGIVRLAPVAGTGAPCCWIRDFIEKTPSRDVRLEKLLLPSAFVNVRHAHMLSGAPSRTGFRERRGQMEHKAAAGAGGEMSPSCPPGGLGRW
jgi:hypothetical protein